VSGKGNRGERKVGRRIFHGERSKEKRPSGEGKKGVEKEEESGVERCRRGRKKGEGWGSVSIFELLLEPAGKRSSKKKERKEGKERRGRGYANAR